MRIIARKTLKRFIVSLKGSKDQKAIKFRLEQQGKDSRALVGVIGQRTRVYEVLRGKRSLSLNMIRELYDKFGIPANVLIQPGRNRGKSAGRRTSRQLRGSGLRK